MKTRKPTKCCIVEHTCGLPERQSVAFAVRVGIIVNVVDQDIVDIRCLTSLDLFKGVQHKADLLSAGTPSANRWRYPPPIREEIEVSE